MSLVCARPDRFWTAAALCRYRSPAIFKAAEGCRSPRRCRAQMEPAAVLVRKELAERQSFLMRLPWILREPGTMGLQIASSSFLISFNRVLVGETLAEWTFRRNRIASPQRQPRVPVGWPLNRQADWLRSNNQTNTMKLIKLFALLVCASSLLLAGCSTCCQKSGGEYKNACGHQCCIDAKTDCAHCPVCNAKK